MHLLRRLFRVLPARRRGQLLATLALMLVGAIAEIVTIGAALPFLALVADPAHPSIPAQVRSLLAAIAGSPVAAAAALLIGAALAAAAIRLLLVWLSQSFVMALGHDLATAIFARTLRTPYADHVRRNSSEVMAAMEKVRTVVSGLLQPVMQGLIATVIALCIMALLVALNPFAAAAAAVSVSAVYLVVSLLTRKRLDRNSRMASQAITERARILQEGMGAIRDIILDHSQPLFEEKFRRIDDRFRQAQAANTFMAAAPRFIVEAAGIVAIALIALAMSLRPGGIVAAIPVLGALALGAQRLLPLLQQTYMGWSNAIGNRRALIDLLRLIEAPIADTLQAAPAREPFSDSIVFDRVSFRYGGEGFALRDVNLAIPRGARIGIAGTTGSGKSTLLDLLMGLLDPTEGEIRIDGRALGPATRAGWQTQIAHVPQFIYLTDDTIAANIAFAVPEQQVDHERIAQVARAAALDPFIETLPDGLATRVGERGIRLSGGQRQRIGIARALYKGAPVLILDEATSALDDATEAAVMRSIMALHEDVTLIMIAHRRSTLQGCDRILQVEQGRVSG